MFDIANYSAAFCELQEELVAMKKRFTAMVLSLVMLFVGTGLVTMVAWATEDLEWVQVESYTPDPAGEDGIGRKPLTAISFSSSSNGNAVGHYQNENTSHYYKTQIQHWNGSSWSG